MEARELAERHLSIGAVGGASEFLDASDGSVIDVGARKHTYKHRSFWIRDMGAKQGGTNQAWRRCLFQKCDLKLCKDDNNVATTKYNMSDFTMWLDPLDATKEYSEHDKKEPRVLFLQ